MQESARRTHRALHGGEQEQQAHRVAERLTGLRLPGGTEHDDDFAGHLPAPQAASVGQRLPEGLRTRLERDLGADLSTVRVHDDDHAAATTQRAGAAALAVGQDVFLGSDVRTTTPEGQYVLAHEVAHTVQQAGGGAGLSAGTETVQALPAGLERMLNRAQGKTNVLKDKDLKNGTPAAGPGGTANAVFRAEYDHSVDGTSKGFFKPQTQEAQGHKAVASSRLARGLGMDDVIARNKFAQHGGKTGAFSAGLKGYEPARETEFSGAGRTTDDMTGFNYADVDWKKPGLQKGMADLQLFDAVTAQKDRHLGNVYVDKKKDKVRGIDDDMAFDEFKDPHHLVDKSLGLPQQVDRKTAKKVLKLKPEDLPAMLNRSSDPDSFQDNKKGLTKKELAAAQARLTAVQSHVQGLKDNKQLVKKWDDTTYDAAMKQAPASNKFETKDAGNYLQRAEKARSEARAGTPDAGGLAQRLRGAPAAAAPARPVVPPLPALPPQHRKKLDDQQLRDMGIGA